MNEIIEIWRELPGYEESYEVSNLGRVRSKDRITAGGFYMKSRLLTTRVSSTGFLAITVEGGKTFCVHKLVAQLFIPKPHPDCSQLRFNDGDCLNVSANNIYWYMSKSLQKKEKSRQKKEKSRLEKEKLKDKKVKANKICSIYPDDYVVQLRKNGELVRRYESIKEVLQVHPTWEFGDVLMNLTGDFTEAYGYRFVYEADYEKLNIQ